MSGRDPILLLTLVAYFGGAFPLAPTACGLGVAVALAVLAYRRCISSRLAWMLCVAFALSAMRGCAARVEADARYEAARSLAAPPTSCRLRGVVAASPQATSGSYRLTFRAESGTCGSELVEPGTQIDVRTAEPSLDRGDQVELSGTFAPISLFDNPGLSPAWVRIARSGTALSGKADSVAVVGRGRGTGTLIDRARRHVRARIEATYHPEGRALGRALVLGETDLDEEISDAFRATGLSHVLAVSGTHLVVAVLGIAAALRAILLRIGAVAQRIDAGRIAALVALPLSWAYADFAGGSGSVVRAAAMLTAVLGARVLERRPSPARALAFALGFGIIRDPLAIADVSFTLSAASTTGLLVLARPIGWVFGVREHTIDPGLVRRAWNLIGGAMATTLAATLACAPVTACLSGSLPVAGVLANLVAAPLGEVMALPFAMGHAVLGPMPALELGAARVASGALRGVLLVARAARDVGVSLPVPAPTAWQLVAVSVGATILFSTRTAKLRSVCAVALAAGLVALELGHRAACQPRHELRVTVLDVGQGDSILIDLPDGSLMLVDGGGFPGQSFDVGQRVIVPVLRARRRTTIDRLVVSHPHPDHFGGLGATVNAMVAVGEVWDNGRVEQHPAPELAALLRSASDKGARIMRPEELCGAPRDIGGAQVEVLAPCPELDPELDTNDGSLVLRIRYGKHAVLLMGDAERAAEDRLLSTGADVRADVLKVGHHGSRTSSSAELLSAVNPTYAVISCGVRNRFGHPHGQALRALEQAGATIIRTDVGGAFVFTTDGTHMTVSR